MKIVRHRLVRDDGTPYPFVATPNVGGRVDPRYLVIHYTAGRSAKESIRFLASKVARASAHVVIARDGTITQMVPFDRVAWHAGQSLWEGIVGLNQHSLGIELDNAGLLKRGPGGKWLAWFGDRVPEEEVSEAVHKNEKKEGIVRGWHEYTPKQIEAALELSSLLVRTYGIRDVIGHDDISPIRKQDPGPLFPMSAFRGQVMGRHDEQPDVFIVAEELNLRQGPGAEHPRIATLPSGTRVEVLDESGSWRRVDVLGTVGDDMDLQGWVHGRFLHRSTAPTDTRLQGLVIRGAPANL
jgi:N-acetylmuramoyl-L-alanine amidase